MKANVLRLPKSSKERGSFGTILGTPLEIHYHFDRAKTDAGHDRLWISVKQPGRKKPWRMVSVLGYTKSAKVAFLKEKTS